MFTVALVGPDGAGKTTIGRRLPSLLPVPATYVYMGINLESSNLVLPTTRLILEIKRALGRRPDMAGPPDPARAKPRPKGVVKRAARGVKSGLRLINQVAEEWFRQLLVWSYQRRGHVVIFDRHFFSDYYFHDIANDDRNRPLTSRVHGFLLKHFYPRPDFLICLDAPAEVLFARKGEGTVELLERRRREYLQLRQEVKHFAVVDATQPEEDVASDAAALVLEFYRARTGGRSTKPAWSKQEW